MQLPYSFRDLRTVFCADTLRTQFGGTYDATDRRWRFASVKARHDAQLRVTQLPPVGALRLPGLRHDLAAVKKLGGVLIASRNDDDAYRRGIDIAIFETQERAHEALADLYQRYKATPNELKALERVFTPEAFARPQDVTRAIGSPIAPLARETMRWQARIAAYHAFNAPSAAAARDSEQQAVDEASSMLGTAYNQHGGFRAAPAPSSGVLSGIVIARAPHHLAILTNERGDGCVLARARIAMPLRIDGSKEVATERLAAIAIDLDTGTAIQSRARDAASNRSITEGPLLMEAHLHAGELEPLVQADQSMREDCDGRVVARNDDYACVMDEGYTIELRYRREIANDAIGARVTLGPSYHPTTTALGRNR